MCERLGERVAQDGEGVGGLGEERAQERLPVAETVDERRERGERGQHRRGGGRGFGAGHVVQDGLQEVVEEVAGADSAVANHRAGKEVFEKRVLVFWEWEEKL